MKGGKKEKEISQNDVTKKCKEKYHEKVAKSWKWLQWSYYFNFYVCFYVHFKILGMVSDTQALVCTNTL